MDQYGRVQKFVCGTSYMYIASPARPPGYEEAISERNR